MKFTKGEVIACFIAGPILGSLNDASREPWRAWIDPIEDILGGIILVTVVIAAGKLIEKSWQAWFDRDKHRFG